MSTIYLRDVPEDVTHNLKELAEREGMSLNRFVVRELREIAQRAGNRDLLEALPDHGIPPEQTVAAVAKGRRRNDRP